MKDGPFSCADDIGEIVLLHFFKRSPVGSLSLTRSTLLWPWFPVIFRFWSSSDSVGFSFLRMVVISTPGFNIGLDPRLSSICRSGGWTFERI